MDRRVGRATAELCGAVIGAGFASGREIAAFFAEYGRWGWLGVIVAGAVIGAMCLSLMRSRGEAGMPGAWKGRWQEWLWRGMFTSLMAATGGAMLAGGGEIAALLLPVRFARAMGMGMTLAAAWVMSEGEGRLLPVVSRGLLLCLVGVALAGLFMPARTAACMGQSGGPEGILMGLCYGGFNVALAAPVMAHWGGRLTEGERRRCAVGVVAVLTALLACGHAVLLRHTALMDEQLPFVMLLAPCGRWGYALAGTALYLAALTTLTACLRGLRTMVNRGFPLAVVAVAALSLSGLDELVDVVYPVLGGGCFLLLMAARRQNRTKM
ncbi:MAG: hypothetical protein E7316_09365 [Clostridiales bacterium]|nr:hypothetical protein [Clostridiales bacterium]